MIPVQWSGFDVTRQFRGVTYQIHVRRTGPGNSVSLTVDGQPVEGMIIPLPAEGHGEVTVEATLA